VNVTNLVKGNMPDITPSQLVAGVIAGIPIIASLLRAFGLYDLSIEQQNALNDTVTWASVFAGALIGGDAIVRTGRNVRKGTVEAALVTNPSESIEVRNSVLTPQDQGTTFVPSTEPPPVNPATKLPGNL
jgi:hypothetical protein